VIDQDSWRTARAMWRLKRRKVKETAVFVGWFLTVPTFICGLIGAGSALSRATLDAVDQDPEAVIPMIWTRGVSVQNLNGSGSFTFGQDCLVRSGDPIAKVKVDGSDILVRQLEARMYPEREEACPPGTLFFIPKVDYLRASDEIQDKVREAQASRERAKRLQGVAP
jgi:hypothetical protein